MLPGGPIGRPLGIVVLLAAAILPAWPSVADRGSEHPVDRRPGRGPGAVNHPVHVIPSEAIAVPPNWPVGADGELLCTTCHTQLPSNSGTGGAYLRGSAAGGGSIEFCSSCHGQRASGHWMALQRAHLGAGSDRATGSAASLDSESRRCLDCHDGVSASEATHSMPGVLSGGYTSKRDHPVGIRYRIASRAGSPLQPVSLLPAGVRLPDGKVSCVSCHNLFNPAPNHLTVPIEGSRLCFACHDMD